MRVLLISANRELLPSPVVPIGLLYVASAARNAGHEVRVVDLCFEQAPIDLVVRALQEFVPDAVGLGIRNLHTNSYDTESSQQLINEYIAIVEAIKQTTTAPVVVGGSGFSLQPERLLETLKADFGVIGEGEASFVDLLQMIETKQNLPRLIRAQTSNKTKLIHLGSQPTNEITQRDLQATTLGKTSSSAPQSKEEYSNALDWLPSPARELIDTRYYRHNGTENIQTKRGCAFECSYCDYPDLEGSKVRLRSPARVVDEFLERASSPEISHIFFVDSVFNVPRSHALAICNLLVQRNNTTPWVCYGSPVSFDDELVSAMRAAGCEGVEIGTDSGTAEMLKKLNKPFGVEQIIKTRDLFLKHSIFDAHTFVLGALDETAEQVEQTLHFVDELDPDMAVFLVFEEDREYRTPHKALHRGHILQLLSTQAQSRPGWVVPELNIRFGMKLEKIAQRMKWRGPSWLQLARQRRVARTQRSTSHARI